MVGLGFCYPPNELSQSFLTSNYRVGQRISNPQGDQMTVLDPTWEHTVLVSNSWKDDKKGELSRLEVYDRTRIFGRRPIVSREVMSTELELFRQQTGAHSR
ncbi:MAG: hypothetical protein KJ600_01490 [Nanoarchaeota archaeon]|nr:hypothetical protein [Nanoarchaeota archaeon]MBU1103213.1 hypothetical protein [Nanoarchaeota archaeon]